MPSTQENNKSNKNLIGIRIAHKGKVPVRYFDYVLQSLGDVNRQIAATDYLKLHRPYWIGNTILHFAYENGHQKGLKKVLDKNLNIDFTIKNQDNLTILHLILQHYHTTGFRFSNLRSILNHPCINTILSAHVKTKNLKNPCDSNGMSHFHIACMANHVEAVEFFLDNKVPLDHAINIDSPYFAGFTGLHLSIRCCSLQVTKILLKRGASIYLKNTEGMTALHMVIDNCFNFANNSLFGCFGDDDVPKKSANEEVAKLLLKAINADKTMIIDNDSGLSCLHFASTMMGNRIVKKLATKGDINHPVNMQSLVLPGYTPLHFAVHANCINIAKMLVKNGADLLAKDANGKTSLDLCMERCKIDNIHEILLSNSVYKEISFTTKKIKLLNFILAMRDYEQFEKFLDKYYNTAHISIPEKASLWPGFTPMHLVVLFSSSGNFPKINFEESLWTLKGFDVEIMTHYMANEKYLKMIRALHNDNSKINIVQDVQGRTPLHLSFRLGKIKNIVDLLLKLHNKIKFPLDIADDEDLSLLHIACSRNNTDLVNKLLIRSNNVNLAYQGKSIPYLIESGWTPLHMAVAYDQVDIIKILLKYGADVHNQDVHGVTPIHLMVLRANKQAASLLSVPNLKECVVKGIGLSHLHAACFVENKDAVEKLLNCGSDVNLAITGNLKLTDRSFEFSKLTKYSGYTPLHLTQLNREYFYRHSNEYQKLSETTDLLIKQGADIFLADSQGMPFFQKHMELFFGHLKDNENMQRQAELKFGITKLHLACFMRDLDWLKELLKDGADVNKQVHKNSSTYGGFTPLHIVIHCMEFMKLLLDKGSNVNVSNAKQETPIHLAAENSCKRYSQCLRIMLKNIKDFRINPTNSRGISHFHIACYAGEYATVKKFLERGNLDINQPTDFFDLKSKCSEAGFTPLHYAVVSDKNDVSISTQLEIVDLLLKNGADPNLQDSRGNTALHLTQRCEIFERIARQGADVNIVNVDGDSPFGAALFNHDYYPWVRVKVSADEIINRLKCGSYFNAFNTFTEIGYIAMTLNQISFEELKNLFSIIAINIPHAFQVDKMGRTVIHNIASFNIINDKEHIFSCASLIELLASTGCDIDTRDNLGRTALHMATESGNLTAVVALLMVGADVNKLDKKGKTALTYHSASCKSCAMWPRNIMRSCNVYKILVTHALQLHHCQLHVRKSNRLCFASKIISKIDNELFNTELQKMNNLKFKPYDLTLRSFISEIDVVARYPMMEQSKKDVIDEFFTRDKMSHFREKFSGVAGILSLQYRKAVKRGSLMDKALISLNVLADFPIPQLCSHIILGFLSNDDLKNLIVSSIRSRAQERNSKVHSHNESTPKAKKRRI